MGERLHDIVHTDLSGALVGSVHRVLGAGEGPVRFLYLMRHKAGMTTAQYQEYWGTSHVEFGRRTPGILGYDQFHVDPVASKAAVGAAGLGVWRVDGVAELHLGSLEAFFSAAVGSDVGDEAIADEKNFVDGENSVGLATEVVFREH
jgi:uncharacterized protein (TIGR02118 family)